MKNLSVACLSLMLVCHPALAQKADFQRTVDKDFVMSELSWTGGYKGMDIAWDVIVVNKVFAICGAISHYNGQVLGPNKEALRRGWVMFEGKKFLTDLSFFKNVGYNKPLIGKEANCIQTNIPQKRGRFTLSFDPGRSRF